MLLQMKKEKESQLLFQRCLSKHHLLSLKTPRLYIAFSVFVLTLTRLLKTYVNKMESNSDFFIIILTYSSEIGVRALCVTPELNPAPLSPFSLHGMWGWKRDQCALQSLK